MMTRDDIATVLAHLELGHGMAEKKRPTDAMLFKLAAQTIMALADLAGGIGLLEPREAVVQAAPAQVTDAKWDGHVVNLGGPPAPAKHRHKYALDGKCGLCGELSRAAKREQRQTVIPGAGGSQP